VKRLLLAGGLLMFAFLARYALAASPRDFPKVFVPQPAFGSPGVRRRPSSPHGARRKDY